MDRNEVFAFGALLARICGKDDRTIEIRSLQSHGEQLRRAVQRRSENNSCEIFDGQYCMRNTPHAS